MACRRKLAQFWCAPQICDKGGAWGLMRNDDTAHNYAGGFWFLSDHGHGPTCGRDGGGARDIVRTAKPILRRES